MFHFAYDPSGRLLAESVELDRIARDVGTPAYVYVQATVERHYRVYDAAFAGHPHLICYAMKANSSRAILSLLASLGSGADIVSGGELTRALRAGIPADRIVFSGVGKTEDEMAAALDAKILCFNVESQPELEALGRVALQKKTIARVSLRVNPDIDAKTHPYIATGLKESKFGVPLHDARPLAQMIVARHPYLELVGVDCHIGSQLTTLEPLTSALDSVLDTVDALRADGHAIGHVDLGGGLGIPYDAAKEPPPHPDQLGAAVVARMKGRPEKVILEPGRVIVGNAGVLLTRVLYVKRAPERTFVIVDAAMNDLMRPSLYQAHHDIWPVERRPGAPIVPVDIVGPICESADTFAKQRPLQEPQVGDLLALMGAGAYGFAMSSTYNSRPRTCEVLVHGDCYRIIRTRETVEQLMEGESLPDWLGEK